MDIPGAWLVKDRLAGLPTVAYPIDPKRLLSAQPLEAVFTWRRVVVLARWRMPTRGSGLGRDRVSLGAAFPVSYVTVCS
jgi:hypothetical protein